MSNQILSARVKYMTWKQKCILALCKRPTPDESVCLRARSVLIRPIGSAIGDAIVTTAAVAQLKDTLKDVKIGVIVSKRNRAIFEDCPLVDELVPDGFSPVWKQRGKWDVFIEYPRVFHTTWILYAYLLRPHFCITFYKEDKASYTSKSVRAYDVYYPQAMHYHLNQWLTLTPFRISTKQPHYLLPPPTRQNVYPKDTKINILLAPYGTTRRLDPDTLAKAVAAQNTSQVRFWLLNRPEAYAYMTSFQQYAPTTDIVLGTSACLDDFLAYIYQADGVMAVDSAAVHAACAYGKQLLALYANYPENICFMGPLPNGNTELLCSDNLASGNDDFSSFSVTPVAAALQRLIERSLTAKK